MSKIKELAKELCTCHHKCKDTTDCVVEDEALLLINQDKSNNFEVKSNNELPSTLTNEDKVSVKGRQSEGTTYYEIIYINYTVATIYADSCVMSDHLELFKGETLVAKIDKRIVHSIKYYKKRGE